MNGLLDGTRPTDDQAGIRCESLAARVRGAFAEAGIAVLTEAVDADSSGVEVAVDSALDGVGGLTVRWHARELLTGDADRPGARHFGATALDTAVRTILVSAGCAVERPRHDPAGLSWRVVSAPGPASASGGS